jgi:hypothetical protein
LRNPDFLCAVHEGENIALAENLVEAELVVSSMKSYGLTTESSYSTHQELQFIMEEKKPFFLIKMCDRYEHALVRLYFNTKVSYFHWHEKEYGKVPRT